MAVSKQRTDLATTHDWDEMLKLEGVKVVEVYDSWWGPYSSTSDYIHSLYMTLFTNLKKETKTPSSQISDGHQDNDDVDIQSIQLPLYQYTCCSSRSDTFAIYAGKSCPVIAIYSGQLLCYTIDNGIDMGAIERGLRLAVQLAQPRAGFADSTMTSVLQASRTSLALKESSSYSKVNLNKIKQPGSDVSSTVYEIHEKGPLKSDSLMALALSAGERMDNQHWVIDNPVPLALVVVIVKPNIVENHDQCQELIRKLTSGRISESSSGTVMEDVRVRIYHQENMVMRPDVIMSSDMSMGMTPEQKERLRKLMLNGESLVLLIAVGRTGARNTEYLRAMCGPKEPALARQLEPQTLRALYGGPDIVNNAVHVSETVEASNRLLKLLFPKLETQYVDGGVSLNEFKSPETTLAIIRPTAAMRFEKKIKKDIMRNGFQIEFSKSYNMRIDEARRIYVAQRNRHYFDELIDEMTFASATILCLSKANAVADFRRLLGPSSMDEIKTLPDCLRYKYSDTNSLINGIHGSQTDEAAQREMEVFFPVQKTFALIKPGFSEKQLKDCIQTLKINKFSILAHKEVVIDEAQFMKIYSTRMNEPWFEQFKQYMCKHGPSYVMALIREGAVTAWRDLIGPVDPQAAVREAPDSLRAKYGTDIMKNGFHGPSHANKAFECIMEFFAGSPTGRRSSVTGSQHHLGKMKSLKGLKENFMQLAAKEKSEKDMLTAITAHLSYGMYTTNPNFSKVLCDYEVRVNTLYRVGTLEPQGVYITLIGDERVTSRILLASPKSGQTPFLTGAIDCFRFRALSVGPLRKIMLCGSNANTIDMPHTNDMPADPFFPRGWYVRMIEVFVPDTSTCYSFEIDGLVECENEYDRAGFRLIESGGVHATHQAPVATPDHQLRTTSLTPLDDPDNRMKEDTCLTYTNVTASLEVPPPTMADLAEVLLVIVVQTGSRKYAGTKSAARLRVYDLRGYSVDIALEQAIAGDIAPLERGQRSIFVCRDLSVSKRRSLGRITRIKLSQKQVRAAPAWYVDYVCLFDQRIPKDPKVKKSSAMFPINRWLDEKYGDCKTEIEVGLNEPPGYDQKAIARIKNKAAVKLEFITVTGWAYASALTDASIRVSLYTADDRQSRGVSGINADLAKQKGLYETQEPFFDGFLEIAENTEEPFEVGSTDFFVFYLDKEPKGPFVALAISLEDDSADNGWLLNSIHLRVNEDQFIFDIPGYRWIEPVSVKGNRVVFDLTNIPSPPAPVDMFPPPPTSRFLTQVYHPTTEYEVVVQTSDRAGRTSKGAIGDEKKVRFYIELLGKRQNGPEEQQRRQTSGVMELDSSHDVHAMSEGSVSQFKIIGRLVEEVEYMRISMRCFHPVTSIFEGWTPANIICCYQPTALLTSVLKFNRSSSEKNEVQSQIREVMFQVNSQLDNISNHSMEIKGKLIKPSGKRR